MRKSSTVLRFIIWFIFLIGGAIGGILLDQIYFKTLWQSLYWHAISLIIGLYLFRLSIRASRNTGRYLARMGKEGDIPKFETNRLVTSGYYACMRHPMHFGLMFFILAWAFLTGSISFILFIAPFEIVLMILMIKFLEEKEAFKKFGQAYFEYKKSVPMFSLKRECIKKLFSKYGLIDAK